MLAAAHAPRLARRAAGAALLLALVALPRPAPPAARAQSPYPSRDGYVANGTELVLSTARVNGDFKDKLATPLHFDGVVLLVDDCSPDPETYLDGALVHYGLAAGPGQLRDDSLAWLVCLQPRYVGFFWAAGNPYADRFDQGAITDAMAEQLAAGNFTGAATTGIALAADQAGAAPAENGTASGPARPAAVAASSPASGTSGGLGRGLLALVLLLVGGPAAWVAWRRRGARPKTKPADVPWDKLGRRIAAMQPSFSGENTALARVVLAYETVGDEAMLAVHRAHQSMVERYGTLEHDLAAELAARPTQDAPESQAAFASLDTETTALEKYLADLKGEADHVETLIERAPVLTVEARKAIAAEREAYGGHASGAGGASEGLPPADPLFAVAERTADAAEAALTAGDHLTAGREAEEAATMAHTLARLASDRDDLARRVAESAALYGRLDHYAPESYGDVKGNGYEAAESLDAATAMLRKIAEQPHAAFGADTVAGFMASLEGVGRELARGTQLLDGVEERLRRIEEARDKARTTLDAARADLAATRAWLADPAVDVDVDPAPEGRLDEAARALDGAEASMSQERPDWLAVLRAIEDADRTADAALGDAREQQARIASLRRQWDTAFKTADDDLERAERYFATHRGDVGDVPAELVRARDAMAKGRTAADQAKELEGTARATALEESIGALDEAARQSRSAYDALHAAVKEADAKRERYRPRSTWMLPATPVIIERRSTPFPSQWGGGGGRHRESSWGGHPSSSGGGHSSGSGGHGGSGGSSTPSSSRRGGGRGW